MTAQTMRCQACNTDITGSAAQHEHNYHDGAQTVWPDGERNWVLRHKWTEPGNKRDRARFAELGPWAQDRVRVTVGRLYDGTRTVARCWTLALDAEETTR